MDTTHLWNRSNALHREGQYGEALDCLYRLEQSTPNNPKLWINYGIVCRDSGNLRRSEDYLRRACAALPDDPAVHFHLALTLLKSGQLREGFREYEWRWQLPQFAELRRDLPKPLWRGESLAGRRILVYAEQGVGDAIQFARYLPLLRAAGAEGMLEVHPQLERLMSWMGGPGPLEYDFHCPLLSLPERFGTTLATIPPPAQFSIPPAVEKRWRERIGGSGFAVGLVWAGNPGHAEDRHRSLPAHLFAPLARIPGVRCWSVQAGPAAADIPEGVVNLAGELTDFGETAGAISALNLVITVDTAVAHLAGSLGKPVWLLLPYASDWRWLWDRDDSPWYPEMDLHRQEAPANWEELMRRVVGKLGFKQDAVGTL